MNLFKIKKKKEYPKTLTIFLTSRCNLNCMICDRESTEIIDLQFENLHKLKKAIKYASLINLTSYGEALLYSRFEDALKYIYSLNSGKNLIRLITNGTLLTERIADLLEGHLNYLSISLNAATKGTYSRDMRAGNFEKTKNSIKTFVISLTLESKKKINLHMVAHRDNFHEIPEFIKLAHYLDIPNVSIGQFCVFRKIDVPKSVYFYKEKYNNILRKAQKIADSLEITFFAKLFSNDTRLGTCNSITDECYIDEIGETYYCCTLAGDEELSMGNVYKESFEKIWFSKKYRELRKTNSVPFCSICPRVVPFDSFKAHSFWTYLNKSNV